MQIDTWTSDCNARAQQIRSLNEVMLLFSVAADSVSEDSILLKHLKNGVSLATHYVKPKDTLWAGIESGSSM